MDRTTLKEKLVYYGYLSADAEEMLNKRSPESVEGLVKHFDEVLYKGEPQPPDKPWRR